ncbi:hypothetical protein NMG60_11027115 [Bertholletia excelsa]
MAFSVSKKKSKLHKKLDAEKLGFCDSILPRLLYRTPTALFLLIIVYLWSSSTATISGNIVHVCVSSRRLNNLYCVSARAQPSFEFPIPLINANPTATASATASTTTMSSTAKIQQLLDHDSVLQNPVDNNIIPKPNLELSIPLINTDTSTTKIKQVVDHNPVLQNPVDNSIPKIGIAGHKNEKVANAVKVVKEQIQIHRSWVSNFSSNSCRGGIYVYELPPKFNGDLLGQCSDMIPWTNYCKYLSNNAMGEPIPELEAGWYKTHQYSLELIFHSRDLKHPCRVYNEEEANLFYVPYYGGLDILRWHFRNVPNNVKDSLALDLLEWLGSSRAWARRSGKDLVFGSSWGTKFLELDQMQNPIKLLIERQPWHVNDIGIPHPTYFHPRSDDDVVSWQLRVMRSRRRSLVSFAGADRPRDPDSIRSVLIKQCTSGDNCRFLNCTYGACDRPGSVIGLFMESEFCLQPPGDSPTRKSVFDALVSGCIPVLFDPFTAYYQYPWHLPEDHGKYSIFIDKEEARGMKVNVVEALMKVPVRETDHMRRYIVYELLPGLVYGIPVRSSRSFKMLFPSR